MQPRGTAASGSRSDRGRSSDPDMPVYLLAQDITARARADFAQRQHGSSRGMRVTRRQATLTTAKEWLQELGIYSRRHEKAIQECPRGWSVEIELPAVRGQEGPSRWEEELFHGTWLSNVPSILKRWRRNQGRGLAVECGSRQGVDEDEGAVYVSDRFETACGYPITAWEGNQMRGEILMRDQSYPMLAIFGCYAAKSEAIWRKKNGRNRQWAYDEETRVSLFRLYLRPV